MWIVVVFYAQFDCSLNFDLLYFILNDREQGCYRGFAAKPRRLANLLGNCYHFQLQFQSQLQFCHSSQMIWMLVDFAVSKTTMCSKFLGPNTFFSSGCVCVLFFFLAENFDGIGIFPEKPENIITRFISTNSIYSMLCS